MKYRSPIPMIHLKTSQSGSPKMETLNDLYFNKNYPGFSHRLTTQPSYFKAGRSNQNSAERSINIGNIEIVFQNPSPFKVPRGKAPQKADQSVTKSQISVNSSVIQPLSISCSLFAHRKEAQEKLNAQNNLRVKEPYVSLVETIQKHQALFKKPSKKKFSLRDSSHSPVRLMTGTKLNQIAIVHKKMMIPRQESNLVLSEFNNKSPRRIKTVSFPKRTIIKTQNQNDMSYDRNTYTNINHQDLKGWDTYQDEEASVFHLLQ